jgi:hypothetical protein
LVQETFGLHDLSESAADPLEHGDCEMAAAAAVEPLLLTIADAQHRVVIEELGAFVRLTW